MQIFNVGSCLNGSPFNIHSMYLSYDSVFTTAISF